MEAKPKMAERLCTFPPELDEKVRKAAFDEHIPVTTWIRRAVAEGIARLEEKQKAAPPQEAVPVPPEAAQ